MRRVLSILLFIIAQFVPAQIYKYIGVENGLSNRMVYSIKKDKKGYMWFLTQDGIDRYDGKHFKHYKLIAEGLDIHSFVNISRLNVDTAGCVWEVGKDGHIFKYNSSIDSYQLIHRMAREHKSALLLDYSYIDSDNNIWLFTTAGIPYLYHIDKDTIHKLEGEKETNVTGMTQIDKNTFAIGTAQNVHLIKKSDNNLVRLPQNGLDTLNVQVITMYYHPSSRNLYIGCFLKGLYIYNVDQKRLIRPDMELKDVNINSISQLNNEEVLIATDGAGVYKMNAFSLKSHPYIIADYNNPNGMNGNNINDIYIDSEQRIWMANYPIGVTILDNRYPKYEWIKHFIGNKESLINNQVNSVIEDSDGDIWYATNNGVSMYSLKTGKWYNTLSSFHSDTENKNHIFITLCEAVPGVILVGGYTSGMYWIDKKKMKPHFFLPTLLAKNIRPDKYIRAIYKDSQEDIWIGGFYHLKRLRLKDSTVEAYPGIRTINTIAEKDSNYLWVGCTDGLFLLNKKSKQIEQIKMPVVSSYVNAIYQAGDGLLYIGTSGSGLVVYNPQTKKFNVYNNKNSSLISNSIYSILSNEKGKYIILSTENSLSRFSIKSKSFNNWSSEQGLRTSHFNAASGIYTKRNTFIIGSGDGAIEFDADINIPKKFSSRLVFSDLILMNNLNHPNKERFSYSNKDVDVMTELNLGSGQNVFSLRLSSINYDYPSSVLYCWKLDGFYNKWTKPGNETLVKYTNLTPGSYKLIVRAISKEDQHVLQERVLNITISPPLWATLWAMLTYVFMVMLIVVIILRILFMRKDQKITQERIQFFVNTAHEIRTPLTLIKAPLEDIGLHESLSVKASHNLQLAIRNTDSLQQLITNLMEFEKARTETDTLKLEEYEVRSFLNEMISQYKILAENRNIKFEYEIAFASIYMHGDKTKLEAVIRNLIMNAIKYTRDGGSVEIWASLGKSHWIFEIKDTGIGIPAKELKSIFKPLFRASNAVNSNVGGSGVGLMLVKRLVRLLNGSISVESTEGKGSTFKVSFPMKEYKISPIPPLTERKESDAAEMNDRKEVKRSGEPEESILSSRKRGRILIVEDNEDLKQYLLDTFSEQYQAFSAENGKEGLELTRSLKPDLVITDIMMPEMGGEELCKEIKSDIDISHIPVIFLSAKSTKEDIMHGLQYKAEQYITKPFDPLFLRATVSNILYNRQVMREKMAQMEPDESDCENCISTLDFQFMNKLRETIEHNLDNPDFSVESLASMMNMSRSSCYAKIRALTNQAPNDIIKEVRLKEARRLLREREHTISEVADITGFSTAKYFREVFKREYKISPSQYAEGIEPFTETEADTETETK